jgi:hypothetical protein
MTSPQPGGVSRDEWKEPLPVLVPISVLYVALRFWQLTAYDLAHDEVFSLQAARLGWRDLVSFVAADVVHPPLFYAVLKLWIGVGGESLLWLKLLPALTATAALVPFYLLCRELRLGRAETATAFFLAAVNAYLVYYAEELRMYSQLLLLTLCSVWLFFRFVHARGTSLGPLVALFAVNLLLVYTQYFGWLVVAAEGVYLLVWHRRRLAAFLASAGVLALCFAPWAYLAARALVARRGLAENLDWVPRPGLSDVAWYYVTLNGPFDVKRTASLGLALFGIPVLLWLWSILRRRDWSRAALFSGLALFAFLPVAVAFAASRVLPQSVWGDRFLIVSAVPYLLLVATAAHRLRPSWLRIVFPALVVIWAAASGAATLHRDDRRFHWDELTRAVASAEPDGEARVRVYAFDPWIAAPIEHSFQVTGADRFQVVLVQDPAELAGEHFWVAYRDTKWAGPRLPQEILRDGGCQVGEQTTITMPGQNVTAFPVDCPGRP